MEWYIELLLFYLFILPPAIVIMCYFITKIKEEDVIIESHRRYQMRSTRKQIQPFY